MSLQLNSDNKTRKLIEQIENNIDKYQKNNVIFVFGSIGSGKSTFIQQNLLQNSVVHVSIDDYYSDLYEKEYSIYDLHKQCRHIGIQFTDWLLDHNVSMLIEGTGQNDDIFQFMIRLKEKGFVITSYFLHVPLELCQKRVMNRNKSTELKIPLVSVEKSHKLFSQNYEKIKEHSDKYHDVTVEMYNCFNTKNIVIFDDAIDFDRKIDDLIETEPQLFQASTDFSLDKGGSITKNILKTLEKIIPDKFPNLKIDVRTSMLAPNWYASIPGWHCDFVSRDTRGKIHPDKEKDENVEHYLFVSGSPVTQFIKNRNISLPESSDDWNIVNTQISDMKFDDSFIEIPECKIVMFTGNELHRATPANHPVGFKWRCLFRATYFPPDHVAYNKYANKIRTQSQVYVDINSPGW